MTPFIFLRCNSWTVSCKVTTPSRMYLPCMKAVWVGWTTWSATELSLMVAAFVKILKQTLRRQIGLYCWILSASLTFGNKIISPKLRRKSSNSDRTQLENRHEEHQKAPTSPFLLSPKSSDRTMLGNHPGLALCCAPSGKSPSSLPPQSKGQ